jgi:redox-regulated HSP33 family molecular chaperone
MKIKESDLRKIIRREARAMAGGGKSILTEDEFTDSEYREIVDIIRAELARVFHTFYRKRNFWT